MLVYRSVWNFKFHSSLHWDPTPLASHHPAACGIVSAGALAVGFLTIAQDSARFCVKVVAAIKGTGHLSQLLG